MPLCLLSALSTIYTIGDSAIGCKWRKRTVGDNDSDADIAMIYLLYETKNEGREESEAEHQPSLSKASCYET